MQSLMFRHEPPTRNKAYDMVLVSLVALGFTNGEYMPFRNFLHLHNWKKSIFC